ncbi:SRPBCC family protein [Streptomyces sp. N2-109]|uniref:SRPBCC family protein n=1 Tax=Streptomyces gossypii TaxID=2883101 RepID=A0ABT2JL57_9ACTN|nr:SRPBCC family protein [Streptomyces gossypii]MCT2588602.1 SRPBCC family protein [Streptomyces gossypii]
MGTAWHQYHFHSTWLLPAPPDAVYRVLERGEEYPSWWPQVREVRPRDELSGVARFRSLLPYDLEITAHAVRSDPAEGVLEIVMHGDLEGWARWTLLPDGGGTRAVYEQRVEVRKPLMRALAVPCRPLFLANHALMMRSGRRGLRRLLLRSPGRGLEEE